MGDAGETGADRSPTDCGRAGELADHSPTRRIRKRPIANVERGWPHQFTTWQTDATSTPEPNMKFMILVKSNPDLEARLAVMSDSQMKEQMAAMGVSTRSSRRPA